MCETFLAAAFKSPGPAAYRAEKVPVLSERRMPAYSMGSRTRYRKSKLKLETPKQLKLFFAEHDDQI